MVTLFVVIGIFLLLILGSLMLFAVVFDKTRPPVKNSSEKNTIPFKFHLKYIGLPLLVCLSTLLMIIWFSPKLKANVGYNFGDGEIPTVFTGRISIIIWALLPQIVLTCLAFLITTSIIRISKTFQAEYGESNPLDSLLLVMGNIVGLPQLIIGFEMAKIFSYNAYHTRLFPIWIFTLILMGIAGIVLGIFFVGMIRRFGGSPSNLKNNSSGEPK